MCVVMCGVYKVVRDGVWEDTCWVCGVGCVGITQSAKLM